ncbi:nicotinamide-nucleotide amidohydrolase family protein [Azoarcus sp. L1K30]|uniref:CinA family protein n=1 Tax=Azoarcus sp. L1K30 TaxID=2820277 RepID=UPI001B834B4B|nr:nicotinamide-nucleotide amidohydrolase family protein [Azoarcus sp. L1K30]MBR0566444.1 nicotinamide-nucleotide amidohydrolase family protein [Azoarcus sp. L1K30]
MDHELERLSARIGAALERRGWMLGTAESCTGGWIAEVVTATAGSSNWFDRGFVTYSNAAKSDMLAVAEHTLNRYGAVSEETVVEMVAGTLNKSKADIAVAVSGVAGPGGGTPAKPVGLVCIAWAVRGSPPFATTRHFDGDREAVRRQTVIAALDTVVQLADSGSISAISVP